MRGGRKPSKGQHRHNKTHKGGSNRPQLKRPYRPGGMRVQSPCKQLMGCNGGHCGIVNQAACKGYGLTGGTPTNYNQTMNPEPTKPITIANYRFAEFAQED